MDPDQPLLKLPDDWAIWPAWAKHRWLWLNNARPNQLTPQGDWDVWLILAGRGFGKTRLGAEDCLDFAMRNPKSRQCIIAPTFGDVRDTCVEGESGLLSLVPEEELRGGDREHAWNRSIGELYFKNGSMIKGFSAEKPERLRGPQWHRIWCDEFAAWTTTDAWDMAMMGLRLGDHPQCVITTTPKPRQVLRELILDQKTYVTRGSTYDNAANLPRAALRRLRAKYEGTRLGRQELEAEILEDTPGALWQREWIDQNRVDTAPSDMRRVVVAIDPAATSGEESDETGIIVAARSANGRYYVLEDASLKGTPDEWARRAVKLYHQYRADRIVGEANNGGDMIESVIRHVDDKVSYKKVHASRGKQTRAEPISALYEQGRVSHVGPAMKTLEDQQCMWVPGDSDFSPDHLDACVWALTELSTGQTGLEYLDQISRVCPFCDMPGHKWAPRCMHCGAEFKDEGPGHPLLGN